MKDKGVDFEEVFDVLQLELFLTLLKRKLTVGKYIALLPIFTFRIQEIKRLDFLSKAKWL